jgi:hypothetical protein
MNYFYNFLSLPKLHDDRRKQLLDAADRLHGKIEVLSASDMPISEHGLRYLREFKKDLAAALRQFVHLLAWATAHLEQPERAVFIDYGGGIGMLAFLAKEFGIETVIYDDIFEDCCSDATCLGNSLGCPPDHVVCGDIHNLLKFVEAHNLYCDALASINVIEHIYNIEEFIVGLTGISKGNFAFVLSTTANSLNPVVRHRHYHIHRAWEYEDRRLEWGHYKRDTLRSYITVRREIIQKFDPELSRAEVEALANATRGLRKDDIESCVSRYQLTRKIDVEPEHPTNTCDPYTGNWQERLLNVEKLRMIIVNEGFSAKVISSYYAGHAEMPLKRAVKRPLAFCMNWLISILGEYGTRLAPGFILYGVRQ